MPNSYLIGEAKAEELIAAIEDPARRLPIRLLTKSLVNYYEEQPNELQGSFDLVFFVNVLKETIGEISGLLRGTTPVEYWFPDYPRASAVDEAHDTSPTGLRPRQAFNFSARHSDAQVQAALLTLIARANVKQTLLLPTVKGFKQHGPMPQVVPEAPTHPFDFLFMVKAVASALGHGQPASVLFAGGSGAPHDG